MIDKFNLPSNLKTESVLVKEDQDRLVTDLAQIMKNDRLAIVKDPRLVQKSLVEAQEKKTPAVKNEDSTPTLGKRKPLAPIEFYSTLFGWNQ